MQVAAQSQAQEAKLPELVKPPVEPEAKLAVEVELQLAEPVLPIHSAVTMQRAKTGFAYSLPAWKAVFP